MVKPPGVRQDDPRILIKQALADSPKNTSEIARIIRDRAQNLAHRNPNYDFLTKEQKDKEVAIYSYSDRQIRDYCRDLEAEGEIEQKGERGPYSLPDKYFDDPKFAAEKYGEMALDDIFKLKGRAITSNDSIFYYRAAFKDIDFDFEERWLFDFILKSGSIIADVMLEAMAPKPNIRNGRDKAERAIMVVNNTLSMQRMLLRFHHLPFVARGVQPYPGPSKIDRTKLADESWTSYELDEQTYRRLRKAFAKLLPNVSSELTRVKNEVPKNIDASKISYKRFLKKYKSKQSNSKTS
jgi:hypothetical protein